MDKNRIFVSSTCYDLIDLRSELKEFILSTGLIPVMSDHPDTEFITFKDQNSIQTCLINLNNCSVVILILSQRYGPSLKEAGFDDLSATHLEYLEAVKNNIKTIVFVRDRLEADYLVYKKTNNLKALQWIKEKDIRLFEIIEHHKKLLNIQKNNWYWTFKNSIDLKERLKIDLKNEIHKNRLSFLIKTGNIPLLIVNAKENKIATTERAFIRLIINNIGNQSAVEPFVVIFKNDTYKEVVEGGFDKSMINYELINFLSLMPGQKDESVAFELLITNEERQIGKVKLVVEIVYRTIYGDLISDISEIEIRIGFTKELLFYSKYTTKRYRGGSSFEQFTER